MFFACKTCDRKFVTSQSLEQHVLDSGHIKCKLCNLAFSKEHDLTEHIQSSCFHCQVCNQALSSKAARTRHLQTCSVRIVPPKCEICEREFSSEEALNTHLRTTKKHAGSSGGEADESPLTSKEALKQRLPDSAAQSKSFICECKKAFPSEKSLRRHLKIPLFMLRVLGAKYVTKNSTARMTSSAIHSTPRFIKPTRERKEHTKGLRKRGGEAAFRKAYHTHQIIRVRIVQTATSCQGGTEAAFRKAPYTH
jgi:uncharacterized Zn-finger protein